jgi:SET domain-containing protein
MSKNSGENDIVFRNGDVIIEYGGEVVSDDTLDDRYGDYTAPYALKQGSHIEDGACKRGVGSLANHASQSRANARFSFSRSTNKFRLVATKNIRNNKEIFCFYGRDYRFNEPTSHITKR